MQVKRSYWRATLVILALTLLLVIITATCIGTTWVNPLFLFNESIGANNSAAVILWQIRLPRVLIAALIGANLAVAGVVFQAILRNPLGCPSLLGSSSGAAFGATLALALGIDLVWGTFNFIYILAIFGALLSIFLVINISRIGGKFPTFTLILTGVMINSFFSAASMFIISLSQTEKVQRIAIWLMGQIQSVEYSDILFVFLCFLISMAILTFLATSLNVLQTGEESALWLGIDPDKVKLIMFIVASVLTGVSVAVSGLIGFVGLMIPHLFRLILGPDHRLLLPASALGGAIFLVITDTLARVIISPAELPVGVITAILGVPFFLYLLRKKRLAVL